MPVCKSCEKEIVFVKAAFSGKMIPCNPMVISIVTETGKVVRGRISHFSTCPDAKAFRRETAPRKAPKPAVEPIPEQEEIDHGQEQVDF